MWLLLYVCLVYVKCDLVRLLRFDQCQATAAEAGTTEASAQDAWRLNQGVIEIDQRRGTTLVVVNRTGTRLRDQFAERMQIAAAPGCGTQLNALHFREEMGRASCGSPLQLIAEPLVFLLCYMAQSGRRVRASCSAQQQTRRLHALGDPLVIVGAKERLLEPGRGDQDAEGWRIGWTIDQFVCDMFAINQGQRLSPRENDR